MAMTPVQITLSASAATLIFQTTEGTSPPVNVSNRVFLAGTPTQPKGFLVIPPSTPAVHVCKAGDTAVPTGSNPLTQQSFNVASNDSLYLIAASSTPVVTLVVAGQ